MSLVLFLFGMSVIETGFFNLSQGKVSGIIEWAGSKPLKGILIGTIVTAVLQSSSAVTVMLIGAVDARIIRLKSAVYFIMGANIGTSATAWIISLSGTDGRITPVDLYPVAGLVGIGFIILSKNIKLYNIGTVLVGFTLIMSGINGMSSSLGTINLCSFFTDLKSPVFGIFAGALTSALTQSSSAGIGILQAMTKNGSVALFTAVPIILGQNIGTCVTAWIAAAGSGRNAKKVAAAHLLFNVSGVIMWIILFYILRSFVPDFAVSPLSIALIHTLFNISSTALILPLLTVSRLTLTTKG